MMYCEYTSYGYGYGYGTISYIECSYGTDPFWNDKDVFEVPKWWRWYQPLREQSKSVGCMFRG